jgi:hypothetical protein
VSVLVWVFRGKALDKAFWSSSVSNCMGVYSRLGHNSGSLYQYTVNWLFFIALSYTAPA